MAQRFRIKLKEIEAVQSQGSHHGAASGVSIFVNANGGKAESRHVPGYGYVVDIIDESGKLVTIKDGDWVLLNPETGLFTMCSLRLFDTLFELDNDNINDEGNDSND